MRTREEAARLIELQLDEHNLYDHEKGGYWHYGVVELRALMDFIYDGAPKSLDEAIHKEPMVSQSATAIRARLKAEIKGESND